MVSISYSFLDDQMNPNDQAFFKQLGLRIAELRKESGMTQAQLAELLKISQQLVGAYEIGSRKIPASMLPSIAKLFAIPLEQLMGVEKQPIKRGPASVLQRQIEQIGLMPRNKQKVIVEVLEAMIKQQQAS